MVAMTFSPASRAALLASFFGCVVVIVRVVIRGQ
jgi:hypothetical protein